MTFEVGHHAITVIGGEASPPQYPALYIFTTKLNIKSPTQKLTGHCSRATIIETELKFSLTPTQPGNAAACANIITLFVQ